MKTDSARSENPLTSSKASKIHKFKTTSESSKYVRIPEIIFHYIFFFPEICQNCLCQLEHNPLAQQTKSSIQHFPNQLIPNPQSSSTLQFWQEDCRSEFDQKNYSCDCFLYIAFEDFWRLNFCADKTFSQPVFSFLSTSSGAVYLGWLYILCLLWRSDSAENQVAN